MVHLFKGLGPLLAAAVVGFPTADAQTGATGGGFIVRLGRDTVAVERYTRTTERLEGDLITRGQVPVIRRHYIAVLRPDGTVARFELKNTRLFAGGTTSPGMDMVVTFTGDSVTGQFTIGDSTMLFRNAVQPGALPFFHRESLAMFEAYGRRARRMGGRPARIPAANLVGDDFILIASFPHADSMTIGLGDDAPIRFRVDSAGTVLGADGRATTDKVVAERVTALDIDVLATAFGGRPLGVLSPPDSIRVILGDGAIAIDYSRPSMRGRKIFGGAVVPWNQVWRTGANAATRFTTSVDLVVGGRTVPTGTYTVWTLPSAAGWKLIFNRQTRAVCKTAAQCADPNRAPLWGTDYNPDSDVVRIDMQVETLPQLLEQFAIALIPRDAIHVLQFDWETTRAWVTIARK